MGIKESRSGLAACCSVQADGRLLATNPAYLWQHLSWRGGSLARAERDIGNGATGRKRILQPGTRMPKAGIW